MSRSSTIMIDGKRYVWRERVALRRQQAENRRPQQLALFEVRDDTRPATERRAAERYREPSLFTLMERSR